jgi:hypothetical protein
MLLAAIVAAFVVVADQMMATWADGHLLAAWVTLWAVAFAAVGLFAGVSKSLAIQAKQALNAWSTSMARRRSDERLWAIAQTDARLMSELQSALSRSDKDLHFKAAHSAELSACLKAVSTIFNGPFNEPFIGPTRKPPSGGFFDFKLRLRRVLESQS